MDSSGISVTATNVIEIDDSDKKSEDAILDLNSNVGSEVNKVMSDKTPQSESLPAPEIDEWVVPERMKKEYLVYRVGYDLESRPIWIVDMHEWNFKKIVATEEEKELFEKYVQRIIRATVKSIDDKSTPEKKVTGAIVIVDASNFKMSTILNIPLISFVLQVLRRYTHLLGYVDGAVVVNANGFAATAINIVKPILGKFMEKAEIYGSNKEKWRPKLLKNIDPSQLPEAYGGTDKNFKATYDWD